MEAIALAGNVIQFGELSYKFIATCKNIFTNPSATLRPTQELSSVMVHLRGLLTKMESSQASKDSPELAELIGTCLILISELLALLQKLRGRNAKGTMDRLLQSVKYASRHEITKKEIDDLEKRINRLRGAIASHTGLLTG